MKFEEALLEAIDEGLSLLGESPKQMVYYHLEETFKINRQDIPFKIEEFTDAIEKIFGSGAKIIEIQIMKALYEKLGNNFKYYPKQVNLTLTDYVAAVRLERDNDESVKGKQTRLKRQKDCGCTDGLNGSKMPNGLPDGFSSIITI